MSVAGWYAGPARAAILAYKERGRRDLGSVLADLLVGAVVHVLGAVRPGRVLLVPVPSRPAAARTRGGDHVRALAEHACALLRSDIAQTTVAPILCLTRQPRDATGLTADQRARNLQGAFAVRRGTRVEPGAAVVVLDDLVTTGRTLAEAARALRAASVPVTAAATVAATRRREGVEAATANDGGEGSGCIGRVDSARRPDDGGPDGAVRNASTRLASRDTQGEEAARQHRPGRRATSNRREATTSPAATPP